MNSSSRYKWPLFLLGLMTFLFIVILTYNLAFKDNRDVTYYPNGNVNSRGNFNNLGVGIGQHTDYWPNGETHTDINYNENGKLDGPYRIWNQDGILRSEAIYRDGQLYGHWKKWDDEGKLLSHEIYSADSLVEKIR